MRSTVRARLACLWPSLCAMAAALIALPAAAQSNVVRERLPEEPAKAPQLTKLPQLLELKQADYPPKALEQGIQADVVTQVDIGPDGRVSRIEIEQGAGEEFDSAAMAAIAAFRFSPAEFDGVPSAVRIRYVYHFVIEKKAVARPAEARRDPDAGAVRGTVVEAGTRRPIAAAEISIPKLGLTAVADADGSFAIEDVAAGKHEVYAAAPGFAEGRIRIALEKKGLAEPRFYLRRTLVGELSATIVGEKPREAPTRRTLQREELQNIPGSLNDPIRAIQNLPGLARAPFLGGALLVRGSPPADTGIYFDGNRIPILYHFLGGPSVISEELLDRIDFYPGGFGAYYGRNLTGAVDVKSHRGDATGLHGSASIDLLQASAFVEGPVDKNTRVAVAARRSYIDFFLPLFLPNDAKNGVTVVTPIYWDYQARADHRLASGDDLSLLVFGSDDKLTITQRGGRVNNDIALDTHVGFHRLQLSWRRQVSPELTLSAAPVLGFTEQSFSASGAGPGTFALPQTGRVFDWSAGLRFEGRWRPSLRAANLELRAGLDLLFDRYRYEADIQSSLNIRSLGVPITEQEKFSRVQPFTQLGEYVEAEIGLGRLTLTPGLRLDQTHWRGNTILTADPRLWARYALTPQTALKAYAGLYHQPPNALQVDPTLGNPRLGSALAGQFGLGVEHRFSDVWNATAEVFYNRRADLVFTVPAEVRDGRVYNPIVDNAGIGRAFGLEVMIRRELTSKLYGWVAYTLSKSEVIPRPTLEWRAFNFDQPHILTVVAGYRPSVGWELSTRYRLVSGNPMAPVRTATLDSDTGTFIADRGTFGTARLPVFSQLDARAQYTWTFTVWQLSLYLDVQNVLNTRNEELHLYDYRYRQQGGISGLPILPTLGIKGRF
jgi:TonB family protein